jgi:hypothetical protein
MEGSAAFCDIGETLASGIGGWGHLSRLDVYPVVPEIVHLVGTELRSHA